MTTYVIAHDSLNNAIMAFSSSLLFVLFKVHESIAFSFDARKCVKMKRKELNKY